MNISMHKKLTIALVAHDRRKADMVDWVRFNAETLSHHKLICTGTTGGLVKRALEEMGVVPEITCMHSGPMGGDALVEVADRVEPDPELTARYEARYQQYRKLYPALKPVFPQLL